jgi:hypothetical protein
MEEKNIVGIHGVPRSGTSWLGQLINASPLVNFKFQPLFSYAFKDYLDSNSSCTEINDFFSQIAIRKDSFMNLKDKNLLGKYPVFKKEQRLTHLVFKHVRYHFLIENILKCRNDIKFILIVRNPLEVLNSWRKAPREFDSKWDFEKEWFYANSKNLKRKEEYFGYLKWKEASSLFHELGTIYKDQIKIVDYNQLRVNTLMTTKDIYNFINLEFDEQTEKFISTSKNIEDSHSNSVFKSSKKRISYKFEIPKNIQEYVFNDLKKSNLNYLLDDF